jgi:hypothetical protein
VQDNHSEYLVIYGSEPNRLAVLLDENLEKIVEYNADSAEVGKLLEDAKQLGPISDDDWDRAFTDWNPLIRNTAVVYRLHE